MFTPPMLLRVQDNRGFRLVVLLLSAGVFAFSLHLAWLAFSNPLELEIRESSVWLHVLAKRAGVDLYDTSRVAFVNMNHGPLDPIMKTWISRGLPALPGHMVTRAFVLLTPIFLFASAYTITRKHLAAALLAAGTLFLVFCHVSVMMLVGRSDATAICGLAICGALAHQLLVSRRDWSSRSYLAKQLGLGAASSAVFLISSRYVPIAAALQFVVLSAQLGDGDGDRDVDGPPTARPRRLPMNLARLGATLKHLAISTALYALGFAIIWVPMILFEFHGDLRSYYRHFFGFFSAKSGWGTFRGPAFHLVPPELWQTARGSILGCLALVLAGLYRLRGQVGQLIAWVVMLAAAWTAVAFGYFKNQGGGGLHYFFAVFALAWIFILHVFSRRDRWGALAQLLVLCLVALALPWRDLVAQQKMLADLRAQSRAFRQGVAQLTGGQPVFGEETHLFKTTYRQEVVDTGDTAAVIAASGYFGAAFSRTYQAYTGELMTHPPKFVLAGLFDERTRSGIMSPTLHDLLKTRYVLILITRGSSPATPCGATGCSQALFERAD